MDSLQRKYVSIEIYSAQKSFSHFLIVFSFAILGKNNNDIEAQAPQEEEEEQRCMFLP